MQAHPARFGFDVATAARPSSPVAAGRIVVGIDGSPASERALRWAQDLASLMGTEVDAVIVIGSPEWVYRPDGRHPERDAADTAHEVLHAVFGSAVPVDLGVEVDEGDPVARLLARSEDAAMLVVGSRLRTGDHEPPDSVGLRCAAAATVPVLVVH